MQQSPSNEASGVRINELEGLLIRRLQFTGNERTRDNLLRRRLVLNEGDPFRRKLLRRSIRRLNRLGVFERITERDVQWRVVEGEGERQGERFVDLNIIVKERVNPQKGSP